MTLIKTLTKPIDEKIKKKGEKFQEKNPILVKVLKDIFKLINKK